MLRVCLICHRNDLIRGIVRGILTSVSHFKCIFLRGDKNSKDSQQVLCSASAIHSRNALRTRYLNIKKSKRRNIQRKILRRTLDDQKLQLWKLMAVAAADFRLIERCLSIEDICAGYVEEYAEDLLRVQPHLSFSSI